MSKANDREIVNYQYNSDKNLNARQAFHIIYSTNKYSWAKWVFDQYSIKPNERVIEFGCGNGSIWSNNKDRLPKDIKLVLTDFSEGMLRSAKDSLSDIEGIDYAVMDIQNIEYDDNSFDCVIANHMLYHAQNRDLAISEVARILKPEGTFYATTNGSNNMKGFKNLVVGFDSRINIKSLSVTSEFGLENGEEQLYKYFDSVEKIVREDSLHITEAKPFVDYVLSLEGHTNVKEILTESRIKDFYTYLEEIILRDGSIDIPKSSGIFIAKNPKK
ncbi:class I SAM-dependent methyltransferase [Clostridium sp. C8-1-8]|uniref:class I SAM-dependent methyltransferase n=1 Tax=Clostridium sp. C8-1-8 TaxID=2698831 RepID=UPI00136C7D91|nr:class I SAM-dependent methyltransferase [Clostridium sp. C8-1-8]